MTQIEVTLDGAYHQIHLLDGLNPQGDLSEGWDETTYKQMFVAAHDSIALGTVTTLEINIRVEVFEEQPNFNEDEWDHIVEGSINIASGDLRINECVGYLPEAKNLRVKPGIYKVRYLIQGLETVKNEFEGSERYVVQLWPSAPAPVCVIKMSSFLDES